MEVELALFQIKSMILSRDSSHSSSEKRGEDSTFARNGQIQSCFSVKSNRHFAFLSEL